MGSTTALFLLSKCSGQRPEVVALPRSDFRPYPPGSRAVTMGQVEQRIRIASPSGGAVPLAITSAGLVVGGLLHWAGLGAAGNLIWIVVAGCGIALSLYSTLESLAKGR